MRKPFIIAEVGSNWKREGYYGLDLAIRHIDDAATCGVSAVKFQFFSHNELYGVDGDDSYQLPREYIPLLAAHCTSVGVEFMCSAFSAEGVRYIDRYVTRHKIASSEMLDPLIFEAVKKCGKPFIVSTGGAHEDEVYELILKLDKKATVLECVAEYPAKMRDYNLNAMARNAKNHVNIGVSDHTLNNELAITAVGFGATVFEKHFDALKFNYLEIPTEATPDTCVSIGTQDLATYCNAIKLAFSAINEFRKKPSESERPMATKWRRRLKVTKPLRGGIDRLELGVNFGSFRSLKEDTRAASCLDIDKFEGKRVTKDLQPQDGLWFDDIE